MYVPNAPLGQRAGDFPEMLRATEEPRSSRLLLCALQDVEQMAKSAEESIAVLAATKQRIFGAEPPLTAPGSLSASNASADGLAPQIGDAILMLRARLATINSLAHELSERL